VATGTSVELSGVGTATAELKDYVHHETFNC
jgi:hypothetical protein